MKKIALILICVLTLAFSVVVFGGCGGAPAEPKTDTFSSGDMKSLLSEFLTANPDRTCLPNAIEADGEEKTAEWLKAKLAESLGEDNVSLQAITDKKTEYNDVFRSQNVIGRLRGGRTQKGNKIIIGASYDNVYSTAEIAQYEGYAYFEGTSAEGAIDATGVVTVLALAEYFSRDNVKSKLTVDVEFVFYGMGEMGYRGSHHYLQSLGTTGRDKILLAVNVDGLGGDAPLVYFDETPTIHGEFIMETAKEEGFGNYLTQPSAFEADYGANFVEGVSYTPTQILSDAGQYYGDYNLCAFTSGAKGSFFLGSRESAVDGNIRSTPLDTLKNLQSRNPGYALQMAVVAQTVASSVMRDGFVEAMEQSKENVGAFSWLLNSLIPSIVVAVICIGAIVPIIIIVRKKERKYAEADAQNKPNVKVAVFGMDYEQPKENELYVDIRSESPFDNQPSEDPFADFDKHDEES
ncbi:MAG: M28 family peptidase [Clostridia bacterium]|nr:M28 family peptidase [Clostridia bacterium]